MPSILPLIAQEVRLLESPCVSISTDAHTIRLHVVVSEGLPPRAHKQSHLHLSR